MPKSVERSGVELEDESSIKDDQWRTLTDDKRRHHPNVEIDGGGGAGPVDHFKMAYLISALLGIGILIPWISVLNAVDYFKLKYPDVSRFTK
jgi:hypothetical protein